MWSLGLVAGVLCCASASAEPVRVGVDLGTTAVDKAASHGFIFTPGLHVDVPVIPAVSVGFQATVGRFGESNPGGDQVTTPVRLSATVDGRLFRQTLGVYGGVGPALRIASTRVQSASSEFSGVGVRPGLRVRTGVTGELSTRLHWGVGMGAVAHTAGVDWDSLASVSFALGKS